MHDKKAVEDAPMMMDNHCFMPMERAMFRSQAIPWH
jgi:hypothetical protein